MDEIVIVSLEFLFDGLILSQFWINFSGGVLSPTRSLSSSGVVTAVPPPLLYSSRRNKWKQHRGPFPKTLLWKISQFRLYGADSGCEQDEPAPQSIRKFLNYLVISLIYSPGSCLKLITLSLTTQVSSVIIMIDIGGRWWNDGFWPGGRLGVGYWC